MVLKIHGLARSSCVRRVTTVCEEAGIPYEIVNIDFFAGEHKSAAYLEKQPFGQIPFIDDDDFILFESRAIARYLALKSNSTLIPPTTDLRATSLFEQAASIEVAQFEPVVNELSIEKIYNGFRGVPPNEERVEKLKEGLAVKLEGYERILSKQRYLAGANVTLADLSHLPTGIVLSQIGINFLEDDQKYPNVARWWKELQERPSWKAVLEKSST